MSISWYVMVCREAVVEDGRYWSVTIAVSENDYGREFAHCNFL